MRTAKVLFAVVAAISVANGSLAGDITVRARSLPGPAVEPINGITVSIFNAGGVPVVPSQSFPGDTGTVTFANNQLLVANKAVTLLVQSPGREDAVVDVIFGEDNSDISVVLPVSPVRAVSPSACCYPRYPRRHFFRHRR